MKIKNKLFAYSLISLLNLSTIGCSHQESKETIVLPVENTIETEDNKLSGISTETLDVLKDSIETVKDTVEAVVEENEEESIIVSVPVVIANEKTEIIDDIDGEKIGYLPAGKSLEMTRWLKDEGYYEVKYFDELAYVNDHHVSKASIFDIKSDIEKIFYATDDTSLTIPEYLSESGKEETVSINKLECFEVYEELDDYYLVKTRDYIGYIEKTNIKELTGTFIVVDISDQILILYIDNEVYRAYPVVTGQPPKNSTTEGLFEIYNITYTRPLVGPGYSSWVDIMMKFHNNEGFHDASYRYEEDGTRHGWRYLWEFGGDTYLYDGSHGCVNMILDDVMELSEYVGYGTKVLIKK